MEAQNLSGNCRRNKKEHQAFADHVKLLESNHSPGATVSAMLDEILTHPHAGLPAYFKQ